MNTRALIVEDDASWQQILAEIVADAGLAADVTAEADDAIAQLRASRHRLAVVDLSLSSSDYHNQDGLKVLEALRRHDPGCVSVLLTGYATVELAVRALTECGAFTCLRKETFSRADFRALVDRALASAPPRGNIRQKLNPSSATAPRFSPGFQRGPRAGLGACGRGRRRLAGYSLRASVRCRLPGASVH